MTPTSSSKFLSGVIEGFYGRPWTPVERQELFGWMRRWGFNTYLYAPKDDLKHRAIWREPYGAAETARMAEAVRACGERSIRFIYALSPGLDIRYADPAECLRIEARLEQMRELGCRDFALLFDDIPANLDAADLERWGSLARAQAHVANSLFGWARRRCGAGARFLFCPTPYCGRMAARQLGGAGYLDEIGAELEAGIDILWTGPEIISTEISEAHAREVGERLRRQPLIWDNLHANDYDGRRFYCGPYAGRAPKLRDVVCGVLSNPNCEFALNYAPLRTLGEWLQCPADWDPRASYLRALSEWLQRFETATGSIDADDLTLLGDCYYLPHLEGPEAEALLELARRALDGSAAAEPSAMEAFRSKAARLRDLCTRLADLRDRELFYALSRRIWELREELALLETFVESRAAASSAAGAPSCASDYHLPGTYRGGMAARLQRLLIQRSDGRFEPAPRAKEGL